MIDTLKFVSDSLRIIQSSPLECLTKILGMICEATDADFGAILTADEQNNVLALDILHGYPSRDALQLRGERLKLPIIRGMSVSSAALLEARDKREAMPIIRSGADETHYRITQGVEEVMACAVEQGGNYVAVLTLESFDESKFEKFQVDPEAINLLKTCTSLVSLSLAARQSLIFEFEEFMKHREFHDISLFSNDIVSWVVEKFKVNSCSLYFVKYDGNTGEDYLVCEQSIINWQVDVEMRDRRYAIGQGYCGWVAAHNTSLLLTDFENPDSKELLVYRNTPRRSDRLGEKYPSLKFKSYLAVPITDGKQVFGVLETLDIQRDFAFSDERLLEMIAGRIASEYSRIQQNNRRESFFEIPNIQTHNLNFVIEGVVDAAMNIASATDGFFLYKEADGRFHPRAVRGFRVAKSDIPIVDPDQTNIVTWVMKTHSAFLSQDITDRSSIDVRKPFSWECLNNTLAPTGIVPEGIRSLVIVPVYLKNTTNSIHEFDDVGVLVLMSHKPNAFQQDEVVITALAETVSYYIWGNKKIAELESKSEQVFQLEQAMPNYNLALAAAAASAGTVHTAKRHTTEIVKGIRRLAEQKKVREDKELTELIEAISRPFEELADLYDRLHDVFRGIEPRFESCSIARLAEDVRDYMEPTFRERHLNYKYIDKGAGTLQVKADPVLMKVVFINLITNSIESNARHIMVEALKTTISRWHADERDAIQLIFKDDGIGIPEEEWENVFKIFYTSNKKTGTGIGLAVNQDILERHDGEIQVLSSEIGKGTTISIKWPLEPFSG